MASTQAVFETDARRRAGPLPLSLQLMVLTLISSRLHGNHGLKQTEMPKRQHDVTLEMQVARPPDHFDLVVEPHTPFTARGRS